MKKYSVLFILALVFSLLMFAGCSEDKGDPGIPETTLSDIAPETEIATDEEYQPSVTEESQVAGDIAENIGTEITSADALPQTVEEIVELFNKSANRIKPEAKKVVKNYENRIVNEDKVDVPKALESTAKTMMDTFMSDDTDPIVYATKDEIKTEFLVPNQSYVSVLKATDVKSASVTDKGNEYVITIKLKDEKNPVPGKGIGSVCDVIETSEVASKADFMNINICPNCF